MTDYKKQFIDVFNAVSRHKGWQSTFDDFLTAAVAAIHNSVVNVEALEKEYMDVVNRHSNEDMYKFTQLLGITALALETHQDFLGAIYMELGMGNARLGQFFTPYHISSLMSKLSGGTKFEIPERGYFTMLEPTCGSGGMIIAKAEEVRSHGLSPKDVMFAVAIDLSAMAYKMAYIQLSLLEIPAEVVHGNSLSLEYYRVLRTPAFYYYGWYDRLNTDAEAAETGQNESLPLDVMGNIGSPVPGVLEEHIAGLLGDFICMIDEDDVDDIAA